MEVTLLADHPHEATKIARWYFNEWACHVPDVSETMVLEKVKEKSVNQNAFPLAIIARKECELVGAAELKYRENKNYPEYVHWLGGVYVAPEYRGRGISHQLVSNAQNKAADLGIETLYLQCESHNVRLYQKHGFQVLHPASDADESIAIMAWASPHTTKITHEN